MERAHLNGARFAKGDAAGFYESWFSRANHPTRPLALWTRYTVFCPRGAPERAVGQTWAIWFDGERDRRVAVREDTPIDACHFAARGLDVRVGDAILSEGVLRGSARRGPHRVAWDLSYGGGSAPILLLPEAFYARSFPKTKSVTASPGVRFSGLFEVDGEAHAIDGWPGSQNHNWGTSQTDAYAWAQVAGFDGHEESFLECITGRVALVPGLPLRSPPSTLVVLRHEGETYALNGPLDALRARARYDVGRLHVAARHGEVAIDVEVSAEPRSFVGLTYDDPPGGTKICHNTKLARAVVSLRSRGRRIVLESAHRAALEVVADGAADGVPITL